MPFNSEVPRCARDDTLLEGRCYTREPEVRRRSYKSRLESSKNFPMAQRETTIKQQRLEQFLERHELDGVLLQHRPNFAWITNGRDNMVPGNTPEGVAAILATRDGRICVTSEIEAPRMQQEELTGTGIEVVSVPWYDRKAQTIKLMELIAGRKIAADHDPLGMGLHPLPEEFAELRWSLTEEEIARYRDGAKRL